MNDFPEMRQEKIQSSIDEGVDPLCALKKIVNIHCLNNYSISSNHLVSKFCVDFFNDFEYFSKN